MSQTSTAALTTGPVQPVPEPARPTERAEAVGRILDVAIAVAALIALLPLFLLLSMAIRLHDGGPVFFGHQRIGKDGTAFRCWKFRSMVIDAEERLQRLLGEDPAAAREWCETQKLRNDPRVTPLGKVLRRTSLDELPQLFNVLRGEMSIVGPRPIVSSESVRYGHYYALYCRVRPGMTGLWQISGRSDISYLERIVLDAKYVASKTVLRDLKIMCLTVPRVLGFRGSY